MSSPQQMASGTVIVQRFNDLLRPQLNALLQQRFEHCLNTLPEALMAACEGQPDGQQQAYLDIIVLLRHQRQAINSRFHQHMAHSWQQWHQLAQSRAQAGQPATVVSLADLTLVDSEEMELNVVYETLTTRLLHPIHEVMSEAFGRLQGIVAALKFIEQLPFYPKAFLQLMLGAFAPENLNLAQKKILLQQFGAGFELTPLGSAIQQALDQAQVPQPVMEHDPQPASPRQDEPNLANILRDIRDLNQKNQGLSNPATGGPDRLGTALDHPAARGVADSASTAPMLQTSSSGGVMLDPARLGERADQLAHISPSVASVPLMPAQVFPLAQEQLLATSDLMNRLSQLQGEQPLTPVASDSAILSVAQMREHIRGQLQHDEERVEVIGKADTDLINLVSAMFDYILDDQNLPTAMKALLGRLQIPLLKVALLDASFFQTEHHPARLLLNQLAKAGISWDEKAQASDELYKKIEATVFTIISDFNRDMQLFERLLAEFDQFYQQQQARIALIDQRTRDAEERRAKAELARSEVQLVLNQKLTGRRLPLAVIRLLQDGWRHVMYLSYLKEGKDSESWRQALKVIDALIWSMSPVNSDAAWLERLKGVSPKLINSLKKGLTSVHFDPLKTTSLVNEIEKIHQETIDGLQTPVVEIFTQSQEMQPNGQERVAVEQAVNHPSPQVSAVVLPQSDVVDLYQGETLPGNNKYVMEVKQMQVGAWVEFHATGQLQRHKLVARIRSMEKLIFANRRGIKVAEMSQMQLAIELSQGRARIVDDQPQIIDRALQSIVGSLNQLTA